MVFLFKIIWILASSLIIFSSIFLSVRFKFIQLNIKKFIKALFNKESKKNINNLFFTLGGKLGVGSIAGTAVAVYYGGIGTIFWMWIICFFLAILTYLETILGFKYKEKHLNSFVGGPEFYIKKGLNKKTLSKIYAILIILGYAFGFTAIQSNAITLTFLEFLNVDKIIVGLFLSLFLSYLIFSNTKKIIKVITVTVPFMLVFYILIIIVILFYQKDTLFVAIKDIYINAFNLKSFFNSFIPMILLTLQRTLFATESGIGTGCITSSKNTTLNPQNQGIIQMMGVYLIVLVCTLTALVIISSDYNNYSYSNINGIEIILISFKYHAGLIGRVTVFITIFLFSLSTILTSYYYGEVSVMFLSKKRIYIYGLKILIIASIMLGTILKGNFIWFVVDLIIGIMIIINIISLLSLVKKKY